MNKTLFLLFLLCLLSSCNNTNPKTTAIDLGSFNKVSVIIDDELWNGEIGDTIRNKFASPVLGLPQEEPIFTLNQYPVKLLEGYMTNSRNIIIIKKENKNVFKITTNEYLKPQIVVSISGKTVKEIIDSLQTKDSAIIASIKKQEIAFFQKQLQKDSIQDQKIIQNKFNVSINIPKKYNLVLNKKKFLWYKKEITSGNLSLIIYQIPIEKYNINKLDVSNIIETRNLIGKKYIRGAIPNSSMTTEAAFSPYFNKTTISNHSVFETKGSWELEHDYMNGPFINYGFIDTKNKRIIFVEGFCYAPSKQKRNFMFELESIIKTIRFEK